MERIWHWTLFDLATLIRNEEDDEEDKGTVTLMTLHSAKGLEFPLCVYGWA